MSSYITIPVMHEFNGDGSNGSASGHDLPPGEQMQQRVFLCHLFCFFSSGQHNPVKYQSESLWRRGGRKGRWFFRDPRVRCRSSVELVGRLSTVGPACCSEESLPMTSVGRTEALSVTSAHVFTTVCTALPACCTIMINTSAEKQQGQVPLNFIARM